MNKDDANESLLLLIGELLYKNQLLREAVASKGAGIELIINRLMNAATSTCSCGVTNQLTFVLNTLKERDVELARRKRYCFNEFCNIVKYPIDGAAKSPWGAAIRTAEKQSLPPMVSAVCEKDADLTMTGRTSLFEGVKRHIRGRQCR